MIISNSEAKRLYAILSDSLSDSKIVDTKIDSFALQFLASDIELYLRASKELDNDLIIEHRSDRGSVNKVKHPAYDIYVKQGEVINRQLAQLGLNPKARKQILEEIKQDDAALKKIHDLMNRKKE